MGRGKVFVVEEAETMNVSTQNALLKTLEEPYGRTLIILLTDQPQGLLSTIRSRSALVSFAPLPLDLVTKELKRRKVPDADATAAATLASGSLGVAIQWLEDGVVDAGRELYDLLDQLMTGKGAGDLPDWLKRAADEHATKQLELDELASKDQSTRAGLAMYMKIAADRFRAMLRTTDDPDAMDQLCSAIETLAEAEANVDANVTVALVLAQLAVSLDRDFVSV